ncbi:PAS domain-containing protein [Aquincola sp. S2]|uniref:histidine kinase n=1 Tax=Pseudaquabacterium terrae TaxID=2732868 RepID=A0ABX2EGP2_9BURK|nr:ATP-binding protein [Aquabacterium terrae]NRF67741.1 PAS domain-containing protein [Aquabacterium terrae]
MKQRWWCRFAPALLALAGAAAGPGASAGPLEDWRAEAARVRLLADNDVPRALDEARRLQATLPPTATPADRVRALNVLTRAETYMGLTEPAEQHAAEAFALASRHDDRIGQAESDLSMVLNSVNQGRLDELVKATQRAVVTLEGTDRPDLLAEAMLRLTVMYRRFEQMDESVQVAVQAMEIARRSGHPLALAYAHQGLALAFGQSGRQTEALEHLEQVAAQARRVPSRMLEAFAIAGMGGDLANKGEHARAEQLARQALAMHREVGAPFAISFGLYGVANALTAAGRHAQALPPLDESIAIYARHPNPIGLWFSLNARSSVYQKLGDMARARIDAQQAHAQAKRVNHPIYLSGSATRLSSIAAASGDHRRAYELAVEAAEMTRKSVHDKAGARMLQLTQRYESESKQRAIDRLTRQTEQQQAQLLQHDLQQRWLGTLLVAVGLALVGTAVVVHRSRQAHRQLQRLNAQLQSSENAVRVLNAELEQRVSDRTAALRQQARYLRTLIDMLPMWAWFKDTKSRYLVTNRAHAQAQRLEVDAVVGRTDVELQPGAAAEASLLDDAQVMASGERTVIEQAFDDAQGTRWMEVFKAPVNDEDGSLLGTVGVAQDISERKATEAAREVALAEAERLAQLRSDFLAQMSHELRTPLSGILGFAEMLTAESVLTERQERCVRIIQQSGQHLLNLINDLLDMSRIDAGRLELSPTPVRLTEYLHEVSEMIAVKAEQKGLQLERVLAPDLPPALRLDDLRLRQVLLNLLSNAVKFSDSGQVTLRVGLAGTRQPRNGARLRFEVEDTGIGMSGLQLAKLFQPFEQVAEDRRRQGGAGLGLAISRQLVRLMGGDIQVDSRLGVGSRFWFELELMRCDPPETAAAAARETAAPREPLAPAQAQSAAQQWTVPPLEELERLQGLARIGDMRQIREQAQDLEQADPRFAAFAQHLRGLALDFRSQAVSEFIGFHAAQLQGQPAADAETAESDKN